MKKHGPLAERFWSRVNKTDTHWLWTGRLDKDGYGQITIHPDDPVACRRDDVPTPRQAHRVSYELQYGPILAEDLILHANSCNTRNCIRPEHLYKGDPQQNMVDREEIGHTSRGEDRPAAKLTEDDVRHIRTDYGKRGVGGLSIPKLAERHGVDTALIHRIIQRKAWKHVI